MKKQLLISFVSVALLANVTGCTSGGSQDESEAAAANDDAFAEEGGGDFAEEGGDGLEEDSGGEAVAEQSGGEENLDGDLGAAESKDAVAKSADAPQDELDVDEGEELSLDDGSEALPEEVMQDPAKEAPPQVAESEALAPAPVEAAPPLESEPEAETESTQVSESPIAEESSEFAETSEPVATSAGFLPVQKIRDSAFSRAGANLNRVYIARPGDDLASVSQKLLGSKNTRDLVKWNPNLSRGLKTGDKVYYQSASDPTDSRMLTFYEEAGVPAATHVTAEGENIRSLSKELLGSSDSWKEIWATNMSVESKGDLPSGVELRYWPEGSAPVSAPLAQSAPPSDAAPSSAAQSSSPAGDFPMDPPADMSPPPMGDSSQVAANDPFAAQESAPVDPSSAGSIEPPPPPPPLDGPPPPPVARKAPLDDEVGAAEDTNMMMGAGIILILSAAALIFFIRKNRDKRIDLGQTQV